MASRILWITPVGTDKYDQARLEILRGAVSEDTRVDLVSLKRGPHHLEYRYYQALVMMDLLRLIRKAERDGYDAAVIGCFYDTGLHTAREVTQSLVVTAPGEATMHIASVLGHKFSIIVGRKKWIPQLRDNVLAYGFASKLASFRSVEIGAEALQEDPAETMNRLREAAKQAVHTDGAEVLILGCSRLYGFGRDLQDELAVPVIDPVLASVKHAEFLVALKQRFGWGHSKICSYEAPPQSELRSWGIEED